MACAEVLQVDVTTCKLHMTSWIDGSFDSLAKWDKGAWQKKYFLQAMNEALCNLLTYKNVPIGYNPYTRWTILLEKLQSSKCHWEDLYDEEHGTDIGYTTMQVMMPFAHGHKYGAAYNAIIYQCLISLTMNTAEYLLLLYAYCCCFCQAVSESYAKQVVKLMDSELKAGKATVDRNKELSTKNLGSSSFTTLLSPRYDPMLLLYVTLTTEISLMAFMKAHQ